MTLSSGRKLLMAAGLSLAGFVAINLAGCNEPQEPAKPVDTSTTDIADATNYATLAADEVQHALNYADLQGVAVTTVYYCSSPAPLTTDTGKGSISVTVNDVDPAGRSTGDSYTTTYNQCVQFGRTLDGSSTFTIDALTGVPYSPAPAIWSIATTAESNMTITSTTSSRTEKSKYTFSNGSTDGVTYTKVAEGTSTGSVTRAAVTTAQSSNFKMTLAENHNTNLYTHTMLVDRKGGARGDVLIETPAPLVGPLGSFGRAPDSGSIKVTRTTVATATTPATKSITTITAIGGGNARVEVDSNGDGVIDTTTTVAWWVAVISLFI
ncbi:MAG: hypothetical protein HY273_03530 [Gammaproteobacteria bacterium]|nr:hypothetical protein [Gammaproteobacteria bacterium]